MLGDHGIDEVPQTRPASEMLEEACGEAIVHAQAIDT